MSELIAMRQRIKAVGTIKKVTHAMRLISMSSHSRLKTQKSSLQEFRKALSELIQSILHVLPEWQQPILWPQQENGPTLNIIIGSQKGLCGNFNIHLFHFLEKEITQTNRQELQTIVIGKKAIDYIGNKFGTTVMQFEEFTQGKVLAIAQKIVHHIWHARIPYSSITIYYNFPKSFFAQIPTAYQLIPFQEHITNNIQLNEPFHWEQDPEVILDQLSYFLLQSIVEDILFQSLIAEQASRFIAMDSSTRNASNLLEAMRLDYNKLRQAKITSELTDLVASLQ
ncbi:MAG: FoF1 ATP synthase subunit gamma [Candidatus Babeliales bacterium]